MRNSIITIIKWISCWVVVFILQKLYFILCTQTGNVSVGDVMSILWHGLKLDIAALGYIVALPGLICLATPEFKYKEKVLSWLYLIFAVVVAAIIVVDAALYPFWGFKLDTTIFLYLDKPGDALASVSVWFILWKVVQFLMWIAVIWVIERVIGSRFEVQGSRFEVQGLRFEVQWIYRIVALVVFGLVDVLMIRGGIGQGTNNVSAAYYSNNQYLNHCAVNPVFNMIFSIGDEEDFGNCYQFYDDGELNKYMAGIYYTDSNDSVNVLKTKRPNILLIVWEGCCQKMFAKKGVTPCLNKIASEGIDFTNCVANSYRTDRGLVCITAGYLGLTTQSLMKIPEKSDFLPAFPRRLKEAGYETTFWYGGDITFTNMSGYMYQAGYEKHICDADFTKKERSCDWGVPDGVLFDRLYASMQEQKMSKPQLNTVMTLSSHEPWDVPTHRLKTEKENAFNYTDECLGRLIDRLKKTPMWDNLLVIITADHGFTCETLPRYAEEITHIPMVWTGGAITGVKQVPLLMNQSDLAATLLGQMGISHDEFQFSRDVLSSAYVYPTATFTYNNGVMFRDSTGCTVYDNDAGKVVLGNNTVRERKAKATLQTLYRAVGSLGSKF